MESGGSEIIFESGDFRAYKDGHVERASGALDTVPAGFDLATGVTSRDVVIDAATGVAARLYLPTIQTAPPSESGASNSAATELPVLVFFHGGYFMIGSSGNPRCHRYVNSLAARARVVAVSVDYRLAPEHLLPAAYDDAWTALNWVASGADPWLSEHGDLGRVFLAGVSAGANIAHNMAVVAGVRGLHSTTPTPVRVERVVLLHPSFAAEQKMESEEEEFSQSNRNRWLFIFPGAKNDLDDPRINPMAPGAPSLAQLAGERLLVCTASEDPRAPRGRAYCDAVRASGWRGEAEWYESNGEGHAFFMPNYGSREAVKLMDRVAARTTSSTFTSRRTLTTTTQSITPSRQTRIYSEDCDLDSVLMPWGHDDYMYLVARENKTTLPSAGLFIIRYHFFYPLHKHGAYMHLMNDEDKENLKWLHVFNEAEMMKLWKTENDH